MSSVGLLYVGAVLFVNGIMLVGWLTPREAAPLNLFVGTLQVITPTAMDIMSSDNLRLVFAASGLYLFGFTYLWVGINAVTGWNDRGLGWFSLFVAVCAVAYAHQAFTTERQVVFGVIWLLWALLWFLFFLVLSLEQRQLAVATGVLAIVEAFSTAAIPGFLQLIGHWTGTWTRAVVVAVVTLVPFVVAVVASQRVGGHKAEETGSSHLRTA